MTVRDQLSINEFDPMNIDVSEFDDLHKTIPSDGNIDINLASMLASQFLRAADRISEILSTLTWHEQKTKDEKKRAFANAFVRIKSDNTKITDTLAKCKAELDDEYLICCNRAAEAEAVRLHFKIKHETFLKGHHLMKDILKGEKNLLNASGFSETTNWGEGKW